MLSVLNPGRSILCDHCSQYEPGVIIRKPHDIRRPVYLCARCLVLALQDVTKWNWVSQYDLWLANSKLGKQIQEEKRNGSES